MELLDEGYGQYLSVLKWCLCNSKVVRATSRSTVNPRRIPKRGRLSLPSEWFR